MIVAAAVAALAAAGASVAGANSAAAAGQPAAAPCKGVVISLQPQVVIGLGDLILDPGPALSNLTKCVPVDLSSLRVTAESAGGCKNAKRPGHKLRSSRAAKAVRCLVNSQRSARGTHSLGPQKPLKKAAKKHSARMVRGGCFSHQCSGEPPLSTRVTQTGYLPCNCSWKLGENIAYGDGRRSSPAAVVAAWMSSAPHRANILDGGFRHLDVGHKRGQPGSRKGSAATYTLDFGKK